MNAEPTKPNRAARPASAEQALGTFPQASRKSGIPVSSLHDLANRGLIPYVQFPGCRRKYIRFADLDRAINQNVLTAA